MKLHFCYAEATKIKQQKFNRHERKFPILAHHNHLQHTHSLTSLSSHPQRRSSRKRKVDQPHPLPTLDPRSNHAHSLIELLLQLLAEVMMLGLADEDLDFQMAHFAGSVADTGNCSAWSDITCILGVSWCCKNLVSHPLLGWPWDDTI